MPGLLPPRSPNPRFLLPPVPAPPPRASLRPSPVLAPPPALELRLPLAQAQRSHPSPFHVPPRLPEPRPVRRENPPPAASPDSSDPNPQFPRNLSLVDTQSPGPLLPRLIQPAPLHPGSPQPGLWPPLTSSPRPRSQPQSCCRLCAGASSLPPDPATPPALIGPCETRGHTPAWAAFSSSAPRAAM